MVHLVDCDSKEKELERILSGGKTMVVRGAAGKKIPHSRVEAGEMLYFMESVMHTPADNLSIVDIDKIEETVRFLRSCI